MDRISRRRCTGVRMGRSLRPCLLGVISVVCGCAPDMAVNVNSNSGVQLPAPPFTSFNGTWTGMVNWEESLTLGDAPSQGTDGTKTRTITFDPRGLPVRPPVWPAVYSDFITTPYYTLQQVGDSYDFRYGGNTFRNDAELTVTQAEYDADSATLVLGSDFCICSDFRDERGTATVTVHWTRQGTDLSYEFDVSATGTRGEHSATSHSLTPFTRIIHEEGLLTAQ